MIFKQNNFSQFQQELLLKRQINAKPKTKSNSQRCKKKKKKYKLICFDIDPLNPDLPPCFAFEAL